MTLQFTKTGVNEHGQREERLVNSCSWELERGIRGGKEEGRRKAQRTQGAFIDKERDTSMLHNRCMGESGERRSSNLSKKKRRA